VGRVLEVKLQFYQYLISLAVFCFFDPFVIWVRCTVGNGPSAEKFNNFNNYANIFSCAAPMLDSSIHETINIEVRYPKFLIPETNQIVKSLTINIKQ